MKKILRFITLLLLLFTLLFYLYTLVEPAPIKKITIATGRETGVYYRYGLLYKRLLEEEGISVNIVKTAGSLDTLKLLNRREVDIGFVQSGTATSKDKENLKSIASIYFEPLWLFYRASLDKIEYLDKLKGKRLSIGEKGSGATALYQRLLREIGFDLNSSKILYLDVNSSYELFKKGKLDAFFTVLSSDSELIQRILQDRDIDILRLKRAKAFSSYFPFLKDYKLYEGILDLKKNIPPSDIELLATTATLVAHNRVDSSLIRLIAMKLKENAKEGEFFPSEEYLEIPIHKASKKYLLSGDTLLEKIFPYWIASNIDHLKFLLIPLLTLLIPLFKSIVPLYRWRSRAKIYVWYRKLDKISENWESFNKKELEIAQRELEKLSQEIRSKTDVPLSFKWEYHTLQHHIDNVVERMRSR